MKILITILCLFPFTIFGQDLIGISTGVTINSSKNLMADSLSEEGLTYGKILGGKFSIPIQFQLPNDFKIFTGIGGVVRGHKKDQFSSGLNYSSQKISKEKITYLEIPILLKKDFTIKDISFYVLGGANFGFASQGKFKITNEITTQNSTQTNESSGEIDFKESAFGESFRRFDYGYQLGIGKEFNFQHTKLFVDLKYYGGLKDFNKNEEKEFTEKNRSWDLSFGILFPLKKENQDSSQTNQLLPDSSYVKVRRFRYAIGHLPNKKMPQIWERKFLRMSFGNFDPEFKSLIENSPVAYREFSKAKKYMALRDASLIGVTTVNLILFTDSLIRGFGPTGKNGFPKTGKGVSIIAIDLAYGVVAIVAVVKARKHIARGFELHNLGL